MGKECCSPLSWHLWEGTKKRAPLKTLAWQAGSVAVGVQQFSQKRLNLNYLYDQLLRTQCTPKFCSGLNCFPCNDCGRYFILK